MNTTEGAFALFFLICLMTVYYLRKEIIEESKKSFNNISAGLVILEIVSLARLYESRGLFVSIPYISDSLFFELVSWITMLTGITLLISGVSNWLPIARDHRKFSREKLMRLDLLRKVEQLVGVENRLDTILSTTLSYMTSLEAFNYGIVCKYSTNRNQLVITSMSGNLPPETECLSQLRVNLNKLTATKDNNDKPGINIFTGLPENLQKDTMVLPLEINNRYVGFFILWRDPNIEMAIDQTVIIQLVTEVIARKIERDQISLKLNSLDFQKELQDRLSHIVDSKSHTRSLFTDIMHQLSQAIPFDFAALSIISPDRKTVRRFSVGTGHQALVETGLPLPEDGNLTEPAFSRGEKIVVGNLPAGHQPLPKEIVTSNDIKSMLAIPLLSGTSTKAVLMIASRKRLAYGYREQARIDTSLEPIKRLVWKDFSHLKKIEYQHNLNKIVNLLSNADFTDSVIMVEDCAKFIQEITHADIVRVSTVEDDGAFLKSDTLVTDRAFHGLVPANGRMITSLMPLHLQAINTGEPVTISQNRSKQSLIEIEARQAFVPSVQTALIIPIVLNSETHSLISIATLEVNDRLIDNREILQMLKLVSLLISSAIDTSRKFKSLSSKFSNAGTRSRLRSSLSGIIGSVDLLRSTLHGSAKDDLGKYFSIIDRSTKKIDECINHEITTD